MWTAGRLTRERVRTDDFASEVAQVLRQLAVIVAVLATVAASVSCEATGTAFDEVDKVAGIERGTPTLVFVYTDG